MISSEKYIFQHLNRGVLLLRKDGKILFINQAARTMLALDAGLDLVNKRVCLNDLGQIRPEGIWQLQVSNKEILFRRGDVEVRLILSTEVKDESIIIFLEEETPESLRRIQAESIYPVSVSIVAGITNQVRQQALAMARSDIPLIITGETGTGKEVLARAIHLSSPRAKCPFAVVDCCGLPASLIESELFGYEPGTFTGAHREGRAGKFELADCGTLFLDEVGDMPSDFQPKLLRILNDHQVIRIGGRQSKAIDIRVIAATNKDLKAQVQRGRFREDLYYRLLGSEINLTPLRERKKCIGELVGLFALKHGAGRELTIDDDTMQALCRHQWPGNIRELEKTIQHLVSLSLDRPAQPGDLPACIRQADPAAAGQKRTLRAMMQQHEEEVIRRALETNDGNITMTAEALGVTRYGLQVKLKKLAIKTKRVKRKWKTDIL